VRHRLSAAASEWERLGRAREALWSARQLSELGVVDPDDLLPRETAFVRASRMAQARARHRHKLGVLVVPILLSLAGAGIKLHTRHRAEVLVRNAREIALDAERDVERSAMLRRDAFIRFDGFQRDEGEANWARALTLAAEADQEYDHAGRVLESALLFDAGNAEVTSLFGEVLKERVLLAEREHHLEQRDALLRRLALYDQDGTGRRSLSAPAAISIQTIPAGAQVSIQRFVEEPDKVRRLEPARALGVSPIEGEVIPPGSYLLTLTLLGRALARYPILVGRAERVAFAIPLPEAERVPPGFVYVAPGRFLFGSTADEETRRSFFNTPPLHETSTGSFLIAEHETTYAQWIEFLRSLPPEERARRAPHVQGLTGALELRELPGEDWQLSLQPAKRAYTARMGEMLRYEGRSFRAVQDWRRFPVSGVSPEDIEAYAGWLASTGRVPGARLCTEHEWERAARGADDREFPHGNHIEPDDADIDLTYGKQSLAFGPDEVGSHPASRSPFGLDDMCGNVFEWAISSLAPNEHVLRGGGFYYDMATARVANRQVPEPTIHDANLGFRLCVTFEP
jgi:formylglycine-generating enzyme required for sulfatase activity